MSGGAQQSAKRARIPCPHLLQHNDVGILFHKKAGDTPRLLEAHVERHDLEVAVLGCGEGLPGCRSLRTLRRPQQRQGQQRDIEARQNCAPAGCPRHPQRERADEQRDGPCAGWIGANTPARVISAPTRSTAMRAKRPIIDFARPPTNRPSKITRSWRHHVALAAAAAGCLCRFRRNAERTIGVAATASVYPLAREQSTVTLVVLQLCNLPTIASADAAT
jgi:hypothetical protein